VAASIDSEAMIYPIQELKMKKDTITQFTRKWPNSEYNVTCRSGQQSIDDEEIKLWSLIPPICGSIPSA
jgi:hypothetical protein